MMNLKAAIGFMAVGVYMLAGLFLIVQGATAGPQEFITVGVGMIGPVAGAVLKELYPNFIKTLKG
jgi:hypothetical protein